MLTSHLAVALALVQCAVASASAATNAKLEIIRRPPPNVKVWSLTGDADDDHAVTLKLNLAGERFGDLHGKMMDIASTRGQWLTTDELSHYVRPSTEARRAVDNFLARHDVTEDDITTNGHGSVVTVRSNVATVSRMFDADVKMWHNMRTRRSEPKTLQLNLPEEISSHIVNVEGVNTFEDAPVHRSPLPGSYKADQSLEQRQNPSSYPTGSSGVHQPPPGCQETNASFPCISRFYGSDSYKPAAKSESVAVINYGLWTDQSVYDFETNLKPDAKGYLPNKAYLGDDNGTWKNVADDDVEGLLDVQSLIGMSFPLDITVFSSSGNFIENIQRLIDLPDAQRPGVVSISYGDQEEQHSEADSTQFCQLVQQLAALGTTFLTASGDNGIAINGADGCPPFRVDFMSACPYVVSVGATTGFNPERAGYDPSRSDATNGWSSGGFSNRFPIPDYQQAAVKAYLSGIDPSLTSNFNASGRGFPDISAPGQFINTWSSVNGGFRFSGGTSASSPIVASILALVNSKCKESGRPRVGFVHPTLYGQTRISNDITQGGAYSCAQTDLGLPTGNGWDPVTGVGSPDFPQLVKAFGCE